MLLLLYMYLYVFYIYMHIYLYVSKCLVLSVVLPVHLIGFTVGEWETFLSIPCMSDMQEIDNKATLTLTFKQYITSPLLKHLRMKHSERNSRNLKGKYFGY